jgi:hypothetical protein
VLRDFNLQSNIGNLKLSGVELPHPAKRGRFDSALTDRDPGTIARLGGRDAFFHGG